MAEQIEMTSPVVPFDFELFEGNPDKFTTVDSSPAPPESYIDPASLKLRHRIGRGVFGDVWVATHHQTASDFFEYHEVVIKMLHPIKGDHMSEFLHKFESLLTTLRSKPLQSVCWLHGITIIANQIGIVMKPYEGSIGDQMAFLKGGKFSLPDVLRYGIELAKGIQQLHRRGSLVLNLKPSNILLDENDHIVLGDFGIPYLLLGVPWLDSNLEFRLGTPNYMAPEQWQTQVRGPISYETDSWGFACSMIEMLSSSPPWMGRSIEEIRQAVVMQQKKPTIPPGVPPAVEALLRGCFEYDLRNRPLMQDIITVFERSLNDVYNDSLGDDLGSDRGIDKHNLSGYSEWFLSKDDFQVGDIVQSRKEFTIGNTHIPEVKGGVVVGLENDGFILVKISNIQTRLKLNPQALQRVTLGFTSGSWVRLIKETNQHSCVGILHHIHRDGNVAVGFLGLETLWRGEVSEIKPVDPFAVGEFVRLAADIRTPKFEWPHKSVRGGWGSGKISQILSNGCLVITFPGRLVLGEESRACFLADPDEVEHVRLRSVSGIVEKYEVVEDFHWSVRPAAIVVGLLGAAKMGLYAGKKVRSKGKKVEKGNRSSGSSATAWLPPKIADILFNETK